LAQQRINGIAATRAHDTLLEEITRPGSDARIPLDAPRVADAVSLMLGARRYSAAIELLRSAGGECPNPARTELARLADRWSRFGNRVQRILLFVPGDRRLAVAAAAVLTISAPALSGPLELPGALMYLGAVACCGFAWLSLIVERRPLRQLDKAVRTIAQLTL
ncbi:MAG: hypothetical protein H7123_08590, partial [Thermoleophilia bacterium]|nr:hypothetical protein [Thermoleophilia bacterium]